MHRRAGAIRERSIKRRHVYTIRERSIKRRHVYIYKACCHLAEVAGGVVDVSTLDALFSL